MKKILLGVALSVAVLQGCKKDNTDDEEVVQLSVDEQKEYDDAAALDFLNKHYLDSKGVITTFDDTTDTDNNEKKLADYNYVKLPSGVIYIMRPDAQPNPGKDVMSNDVISFFNITKTYSATKTNDKITYSDETTFINNVANTGVPSIDPAYYYVKSSVIKAYNTANSTTVERNFYEIEGLQEALKYFKSFDNRDIAEDYNMQGVIIVPSRAAFARDNSIYGTAYQNRSFVPHFHIPLQSGSDELLKKMKRRYLTRLYFNRINKIREVMPNAAIGVDVIVGFPGETEELFMETYNFLNDLPISYLHVFTYSERENTEAADMQGAVPIPERKRRNKMLRILSEKKKMEFYRTQLGNKLPVLWEHENKNGLMYGFTENYVRVVKPFDEKSVNQIEEIVLDKITEEGNVSIKEMQFEDFLAKI